LPGETREQSWVNKKNKADYILSKHNIYWPVKGYKREFERMRAPVNKNRPNLLTLVLFITNANDNSRHRLN